MSCFKVFIFFLFVRILSIFVVKTWYVPDEFWQSLEVAHKITFGYGHLTWEWTKGIRSYLHPIIISILYKILLILKLDEVHLLVLLPRVLQALLTSYSDYRFYKWCGNSKWSIFIISTAWFIFYTGSRTLSNTVEMSLTVIALSYFPWKSESSVFLFPVALVCFIRPTAIIPWFSLCIYHLTKSSYAVWELIVKKYVPVGVIVGGICIGIDSYGHGSLVITPIEFFKANVIHEIGSFYGTHAWHWYFSVGLPTTLGIATVAFLLASIYCLKHKEVFPTQIQLLISVLVTLVVQSFLPHKEFRFVLPLIPMCLYITTIYLTTWSRKASKLILWTVALGLFIGNIIPAVYLSTVHQKGTIDVMPHLAKISKEYVGENGRAAKIMFLMPCHSTPYYSHIHTNVTMRFLTCEPNFKNVENYMDEADQFYKDPSQWIRSHFPIYPRTSLPTHLVLFDNLVPRIQDFLTTYKEILLIFHSDIASERIGKNVVVYEQINTSGVKTEKQGTPMLNEDSISNDLDK